MNELPTHVYDIATLSMAVPALPLETIEQIFDLLEEYEDQPRAWDNGEEALPPKHSKSLLMCHMVSKQFRTCALRRISRKVYIAFHDTPRRLKRLQAVVSEEVNPELGSLAAFVKEVDILTLPPQCMPPQECLDFEKLEFREEAVLQVLKAFDKYTTIQKLSILGREFVIIDWKSLPLSVQKALQSLIQLPSVVSLCLRHIRHLPAPLLASNVRLKSLTIDHWGHMEDFSSVTASLPELERLNAQYLCVFPEGLSLPSLRTVNIRNGDTEGSETCWAVISRASKTLKNLSVYDTEELNMLLGDLLANFDMEPIFPKNISIESFPQLENFVYSNDANRLGGMSPTLQDALHFFDVSRPVPNLRAITFVHSLIGDQYDYEKSMAINERAWRELDRALASGHFSGLQKLCMNVGIGWGSNAGCVRSEIVRASILDLFCELRKLSISIDVDITVKRK